MSVGEASSAPRVLGVGIADARGIAGTGGSAGIAVDWQQLGQTPPGNERALRAVFGHGDPTWRRLDRLTRALLLAVEAAGVGRLLSGEQRQHAALVVETVAGCVDSDLRFGRSLGAGLVDAAAFPYTLPSTCLGEAAMRHGLRGPTLCLSVGAAQRGAALREAAAMLAAGEVQHAVVGCADASAGLLPQLEPGFCAVVAVLAGTGAGAADRPGAVVWPGDAVDPWAALARACRMPRTQPG